MSSMKIGNRLTVQPMRHGTGFEAWGIRGADAAIDPFLMADHYRMSQPTFGSHPHAGFSAVTYMFDDAETGFNNRDSLGDHSEIRAGDNHWSVAGRGIVHDEVPVENGKVAHGLQIFVNLAAKDIHIDPYSIHILREDMPRVAQAGGAHVKVAFGAYNDAAQSIEPVKPLPTDVSLFDISIEKDKSFSYHVPSGTNAFMLVVKGSVAIDGEAVSAAQAIAFGREGGMLELIATEDARIALFLGTPFDEPVVRHGPFAMKNQADIQRAITEYQTGKMGTVD
jgi:redox-sensitive bicupin YhaK (pirin superfamily)